jgi:hypothetical protein
VDGGFTLASVGLNYLFDDYWSLSSQLTATDAKPGHPAQFLDDDVGLELTVSLTF